ncbi:hypothetical protein [Streptomyces sp. NPDC002185]|uniref:hypothetical protein n=1 Tax=Streptomyces sp. NPDC002185 TaxID=3364636 RepID=UPI0036CA82DA
MKKYLLAAAGVVAAAVIAAPAAVGAAEAPAAPVQVAAPAPVRAAAPVVTAAAAQAPARIRTVRPGERIDAGQGYTVWLTADGKHWADPDGFENFRSVVDGNIDRSLPGVSHQSEGGPADAFHSGLFYGTRKAGRVVLTDAAGRRTAATLVALPGHPDWGVWYAHAGASEDSPSVTLYDRAGKVLAELPARTS